MKAIVQHKYGSADDLSYEDVELPKVADDEVLVQVRATSVHPDVWHVVSGRPVVLRLFGNGVFTPRHRIPGTDVAGVVAEVGKNVRNFAVGDAVFGQGSLRLEWVNGGTFAEYVSAPASALVQLPQSISFEVAAALPTSGLIALNNLDALGPLTSAHRILINGACGGVGSLLVQIAKAKGAHVTGVDRAETLEQLRELGADQVIDYAREDFTQSDLKFDFIVDVASTLSVSRCKRVLGSEGKYLMIGHDHFGRTGGKWLGSLPAFLWIFLQTPFIKHHPKAVFKLPNKQESLAELSRLVSEGKLTAPIARVFPLSQAGEALRYLQSGAAVGRIVLTP